MLPARRSTPADAPRDDLAALRRRMENRVTSAVAAHVVTGEVLSQLRAELAQIPTEDQERLYASGSLTTQEMVVLRLLVQGGSTKSIAEELVISPATARNHVAAILAKLMVHSRTEAVLLALRDGLV